jgi:hypothetical protein
MTQSRGDDNRNSVNSGPSPKKPETDEFDITGNVRKKGEDPSPDDRERGESTSMDRNSPVDVENG